MKHYELSFMFPGTTVTFDLHKTDDELNSFLNKLDSYEGHVMFHTPEKSVSINLSRLNLYSYKELT